MMMREWTTAIAYSLLAERLVVFLSAGGSAWATPPKTCWAEALVF